MQRRSQFFFALLFLLVGSMVALGASGQLGYPGNPTTQVGVGYSVDAQTLATPNVRSAIAVVDTLTTANVLSLPEFKVLGRQTLILSGRFTNAAATVGVQIAYVYKAGDANGSATYTGGVDATHSASNTIKEWSSVQTLTASSSLHENSYYESAPIYLDSNGAVTVRVCCTTAPSAGTVTLVLGSE